MESYCRRCRENVEPRLKRPRQMKKRFTQTVEMRCPKCGSFLGSYEEPTKREVVKVK